MPTLKQRKYSQSSTSARGSGNGANLARARERPRPEPELEPPQRQRQQPPSQPASQASQQADDGQALDQQGVIDAMVEVQNHGADLGLPPGGPLQVEPWPPLLVGRRANLPSAQQQPPPPPPPRQQQQQQPSRETLLLSIARMERCSRCHLRTWSFVQDPITGGGFSFKSLHYLFIRCPSYLDYDVLTYISSILLTLTLCITALRTNALTIPNEVYVCSMYVLVGCFFVDFSITYM